MLNTSLNFIRDKQIIKYTTRLSTCIVLDYDIVFVCSMEEPDSIISDHSLSRRICAASLHDGLLFRTDDKIRVENVCADDEPSDAEQDQISQGILKVDIDFFVKQ